MAQGDETARGAAQGLYEAGQFAEAALAWAEIAADEPHAVDARINAAQAYLQSDDLGRAMLYFRRAQALDPRHAAVQIGLALVRALRVDIMGDESGILPAVERLTVEIVSAEELSWLTVIAWSAAFGFGAAAVLRPRWRRYAAGFAVIAAALLVLLVARDLSQRRAPSAVVTAFETVLQSEPDAGSVALSRVYAGAEARIADRRAGWLLITLPDGRAGWVPETDAAPVRPLSE